MKFVMSRTHTVASTTGHSVAFTKGVPAHVPKEMHKEVLAAGAVPADEDDEVSFETEVKKVESPEDPDQRKELIAMALADIKQRDVREEFTATGTPKAKAVEKVVGFEVPAREIGEIWAEMTQAQG